MERRSYKDQNSQVCPLPKSDHTFDFLLFRLSPSNPPPSSSSFSREAIKRASLLLLCRKAARRKGKSKSQTRPFSTKSRRGEESGSPRQKKETFRLLEIGRAIKVEEGVAFRSVSSTWQILAALPNQTFASPFLISFLPPSCLLGKGQKKSPISFFSPKGQSPPCLQGASTTSTKCTFFIKKPLAVLFPTSPQDSRFYLEVKVSAYGNRERGEYEGGDDKLLMGFSLFPGLLFPDKVGKKGREPLEIESSFAVVYTHAYVYSEGKYPSQIRCELPRCKFSNLA